MSICYLNGELMPLGEARIPVLDRGFIFGDGVYEVIPVYARQPFHLDWHMKRLQTSADGIRLTNPYSFEKWGELVRQIVERNEWDDQSIYIQVTRGVAPRNHAFPKPDIRPTVFIMSGPLVPPPAAMYEKGVPAITLEDNRWLRCNLKTTALLANCLLRQEAEDAGCPEAVLIREGFLTEASSSNVFVVKNGTILTPPKDHLILPGITYDVVIELARHGGIPLEARQVTEQEVRTADELWLTSSTKEVLPITTLDGKPVGNGRPGPMFHRMRALFEAAKPAKQRRAAHA